MDTEEMYERGVADAEQGDPHPFYYQHYYHYRRGYDKARRHLRGQRVWSSGRSERGWLIIAAIVLLVGIGSFVALRSRAQSTLAIRPLGAAPTLSIATRIPERSPIFPTATPAPAPAVVRV